MLRQLLQNLQSLSSNRGIFDPSQFDDPMAMQTNWTPAKSGGSNFRTHKLTEVNSSRLEFRASIGAMVFYLIFLLIGVGLLIGLSALKLSSQEFSFDTSTIIPMLIGLVFAILGGYLLYSGTAPIVFDKLKGFFWKGWKAPDEYNGETLKHFTELGEIHALQLISEYCSGNKSSYYSYELNLVLKNGNRINVVDHGNPNKLRKDAAILSAFLGKPVWDAIR